MLSVSRGLHLCGLGSVRIWIESPLRATGQDKVISSPCFLPARAVGPGWKDDGCSKRSCQDLFVLLGASCRWRLGQAAEVFDCWRTLVWGLPWAYLVDSRPSLPYCTPLLPLIRCPLAAGSPCQAGDPKAAQFSLLSICQGIIRIRGRVPSCPLHASGFSGTFLEGSVE